MRRTKTVVFLSVCIAAGMLASQAFAQGGIRGRAQRAREAADRVTDTAESVPTSLPTGAGHSTEKKHAAWIRMDQLLTDYNHFASGHGMSDALDEYSGRWSRFTEEWAEFAPEFFSAYGTTSDLIQQTLRGIDVPDGVLRHLHTLAADAVDVDVPAKQKQIAAWAAEQGERLIAQLEQGQKNAPDRVELHLRRATHIARLYNFAEELAPGTHTAKLEQINQQIAELDAANLKTIAEVQWPGHNTRYNGTDTPKALAAAALEFLRANPQWTRPEYDDEHIPHLAAVSGSGWQVYKRAPLTGVPTQYSLDMVVGFRGEKNTDVLYVYQMVFYTGEAAGVTPNLPFRYANSRQYAKHQMLLSNAPDPED